jgi:hypothetical protein
MTNSIEQNPFSEADSRSAGREIPRILWTADPLPCSHNHNTGLYPDPL